MCPGKTGNLEKKGIIPILGESHHVASCRYCRDYGSILQNGKLLEGSEQRSNVTFTLQRDHSGCSADNGQEKGKSASRESS